MMKLYVYPLSSNARKVVLTAKLLDIPVELVTCDLSKGEQRQPSFLALNPSGKVPVLQDGDFTLSESHAIMQYLADKKPGNTLYPTDLRARADVNRWMFWCSNHWAIPISGLVVENILKKMFPLGDPDPVQIQRHEEAFHALAKVLDAHLASRSWLAGGGETMTLADIAVGTPLMAAVPGKFPLEPYANIRRWFGAIQDLPAWKETAG